ncbi:MAG TPA: haloacid dehalogenase type II [Acetobacteraceae bacterium]|nr:haloacid dehalogenase type II [Acetobacteraceae bacterium]
MAPPRLTDFRVLSFDCYGTLIDWETGIATALQPLLAQVPAIPRDAALEAFARHETRLEAEAPATLYRDLLARVHAALALEWRVPPDAGADQRFAASVADWPAFPDSVTALRYLKQHYKLAILSNVDRDSFRGSQARLGVAFDLVCTAQDVGSYKPDPKNFRYLIARLGEQGIAQHEILHVAQSLFHDHAPANALGLASAWIDRRHASGGWGATSAPPAGVHYDFRFTSLEDLAAAHRQAHSAADSG